MLSGPSQERLDVCGHYSNVSFDVGKGRLRREQQMEEIRMRSLELLYGKGHESSQILSFDTMQLGDFSSMNGDVLDEIWSEDVNLQLHATTQIEKLLSIERECPTTLVKNGVVRRFVHFLMRYDFLDLQYEAGWALIEIFRGTCSKTKDGFVREVVPCFVRLLDSPSDDVCGLAVFALGVFADYSPEYTDLILRNGVLVHLLKQLEKHANLGKHAKLSMLRNLTWTLSLFCEEISDRSYDLVKPALTTLECLLHSDDEEVMIHLCWAIQALSFGGFEKIDALMDAGLCPILVKHFVHSSSRVRVPLLMTAVRIPFQKNYIQALIENGALGHLLTLLSEGPEDEDRRIKMQACWVISDILCGNECQIQAVIDGKLFGPLVKLLESSSADKEGIQAAATKAISKATSRGSRKQIEYIVNEYKIINYIYNLISSPNPVTVTHGLEVVENLLEAGGYLCPSNPYRKLIVEEAKCVVEAIEKIRMEDGRRFNYETTIQACHLLCVLGFNDDFCP